MVGETDVGLEGGLAVDDAAAQRAITHTSADIWSGQHHSISDNELESDSEDDSDSGSEGGVGPDDGWKLCDDEHWENMADRSYGLSAMDML